MVLEAIYVVRHGFRSNWVVDPNTGTYYSNIPTPTGIPSDPALASHGVDQAKELAAHLTEKASPPIDVIFSSPFYRCIQTLAPTVTSISAARTAAGLQPLPIHIENGLGEFYGLARFDHPSPASNEVLATHFNNLNTSYEPVIRPSVNGESLPTIHDRIAYCLHHVIRKLDADPAGPKSLLICTHAASMICIGRALTGNMPSDFGEDDFKCFTCSMSKFVRRNTSTTEPTTDEIWDPSKPETIPDVKWKDGRGVQGGWDCKVNGDCSFLSKGEERGWNWAMEDAMAGKTEAANAAVQDAA